MVCTGNGGYGTIERERGCGLMASSRAFWYGVYVLFASRSYTPFRTQFDRSLH